MHRLSLALSTLGSRPDLDMIGAAAKAGFDTVTLNLASQREWIDANAGKIGKPNLIAEIKSRLGDAGLSLLIVNGLFIRAETKPEALNPQMDDVAELAPDFYQAVIFDADLNRAADNFARACEMAASRGMKVAIEFKDDSSIAKLAGAARFVAESGLENAGIALDVFHLSRSGGTPLDAQGINRKLISYIELSDAPLAFPAPDKLREQSRSGRSYPGQGELWLRELLDCFPGDIPLNIESTGAADPHLSHLENAEAALAATRDFLRKSGRA